MKNVYQKVAEFRINLLRRDSVAQRELLLAYNQAFKSIEEELTKIANQLGASREGASPSLFSEQQRLRSLQEQVTEAINDLTDKAAGIATRNQGLAVTAARDEAVQLIAAKTATDDKIARALIEKAGHKFVGTQEAGPGEAPFHLFNDSESGSTLMLQTVTPETLAAKVAEHRAKGTNGTMQASVEGIFNKLPADAIAQLVGVSAQGNPVREVFDGIARELGLQTGERIKRALVQGLTLGWSPDRITRLVRREADAQGGNPSRSPAVVRRLHSAVRNETFRAYREATRATYQENSEVVKKWRWVSRQGPSTCVICWSQDGRTFPLSVPFASHPNCRCVMTPMLDREKEKYVTGPEKFDSLEPGVQRSILGDRSFEALEEGKVDEIGDFVEVVHSEKWGTSRARRNLDELLKGK